jgi:hypothetical protein
MEASFRHINETLEHGSDFGANSFHYAGSPSLIRHRQIITGVSLIPVRHIKQKNSTHDENERGATTAKRFMSI